MTHRRTHLVLATLCVGLVACGGSSAPSSSEDRTSGGEATTTRAATTRAASTAPYAGEAEATPEPGMMDDMASPPPSMEGGGAVQTTRPSRQPQRQTVQVETIHRDPGPQGVGGARLEFTALMGTESEFATALSQNRCEDARDLRDRICDLSERICDIAESHPDHVDTRARCRDGARRCETATDRVDACD